MPEKPSAWAGGTGASGHDPWSVDSAGAAEGWTAAAAKPDGLADAPAPPLTRGPPWMSLRSRLAFPV